MPTSGSESSSISLASLGDSGVSTGHAYTIRTDTHDSLTCIIHGTFATKALDMWWRKKGGFARAVEKNHPGVWRCGYVDVEQFSWSGKNEHEDRVEGGGNLARFLEHLHAERADGRLSFREVDVIAHSHGGNVVLEALKRLARGDIKVGNVVLIATPQVRIRYHTSERTWYEWAYFNPRVFRAIKGRMYNIFSEEDTVQTYWADVSDGISGEQIPNRQFREEIEVDRRIEGPGSARIANIRQETSFSGRNTHGVLHNLAMGRAIGFLLEGVPWPLARERAGAPSIITDDTDMGDFG